MELGLGWVWAGLGWMARTGWDDGWMDVMIRIVRVSLFG